MRFTMSTFSVHSRMGDFYRSLLQIIIQEKVSRRTARPRINAVRQLVAAICRELGKNGFRRSTLTTSRRTDIKSFVASQKSVVTSGLSFPQVSKSDQQRQPLYLTKEAI